ncbi:MAG: efflux RND transporter periplasmic adaptor subunit [Candidatus Electryonea clarkiae]|nr:efflux RND transporter periplasmic adaptor subunit [Candidatus Electryonea clarkiae]MDP8286194.1 efflux RND transporter periplasmic adaptor subunit [Candidatus Electryonea clarkiae]
MFTGKKITILLLIMIVAGATLSFVTGCSKDVSQTETGDTGSSAIAVTVQQVQSVMKPEIIFVSGFVSHSREAVLSFKTGGIVSSIPVETGERFNKNEILAELDTTEIAAEVKAVFELRKKLERDFERVERLHSEQVTTLQQLQDIETELERIKAAERRAMFNLHHSVIRAPFDGIVAFRAVNEGEIVGAGSPILRIVRRDGQLRMKVGVPSRFINSIKIGSRVQVELDVLEDKIDAKVVEMSAVAEPGTGNFVIEIGLPHHKTIREGMIARAWIEGPPRKVIVLPASSLAKGDNDRGAVFITQESEALSREVRIIDFAGDSIYIEPDIPDGSDVVIIGTGYLSDGSKVLVSEGDHR